MNGLILRTCFRSSDVPEEPNLTSVQTLRWGADLAPVMHHESDVSVLQRVTDDPHAKYANIVLELSNGLLTSNTASSSQRTEKDTRHRVEIPRILFAHICAHVENANTAERAIDALNFFKFADATANRLAYLCKAAGEEHETIELQSLRGFIMFVMRRWLPPPTQIGITADGLIQAVWRLPRFGTLVMNFLKLGDIAFTCLYSQQSPGARRRKISGELPPHLTMRHIDDFVSKLTGA